MTKELVRLIKHSGVYGLGIVLSKSLGFFMIPVYTRYLVPKDYGILELLDMLVFISSNIAAMGIYGAVFRFYAAYESEKDKKEVIATALFYSAGALSAFAMGLIYWASPIAQLLLGKATFAPFVRIVALTFLFGGLTEVPQAYWRAQGRSTLFVCVGLARTLTGATTLVVFLVALKWGILGALYANLLASGVWGLTLLAIVLAALPWKIEKKKLKEMLHYGLPTVAWGIAGFILVFSDRLFLRHYGTLSDVGVYALGYKLAAVVTLLVNVPFNMAWQWQQFEIAKRENAKQVFAKVETYVLMVTVLVALGVSILAGDILRVMTPPTYWGAAYIVPLIALSYVLIGLQYVVSSGIYIECKTIYLGPMGAFTAFANLALNYLLISRYLAMGAAIATVLSFAVQLLLTLVAAQRVYRVQYEYMRNAILLGAATAIYLAGLRIRAGPVSSAAIHLLLLSLFFAVSFAVLDRQERQMVRRWGLAAAQELRGVWARARHRPVSPLPAQHIQARITGPDGAREGGT